MKTININTIANRVITLVAVVMLGLNFASCSGSDAEPANPAGEIDQVTAARITYTYRVPQELLDYAEITVCYNNNAGTDAKWQPMLDPNFTVTYDLTKFPVTAPVVMVYELTNRSAVGKNVNWDIRMETTVEMTIGGRTEIKTNNEVYKISGDAARGLETLMNNVLDRTYAVKIAKTGGVQFVH